jgi:hypothetical protein
LVNKKWCDTWCMMYTALEMSQFYSMILDIWDEVWCYSFEMSVSSMLVDRCEFYYFFWCVFCSSSAQAVQNLGLAVITLMAGKIVDSGGYLLLEVFFLGWLCCMSGYYSLFFLLLCHSLINSTDSYIWIEAKLCMTLFRVNGN